MATNHPDLGTRRSDVGPARHAPGCHNPGPIELETRPEPHIAVAATADRSLFESHLRAFLAERAADGSFILPTAKTTNFYLSLFDAYTTGREPGVVIISPDGASIAGHLLPFDTTYGQTATGWFTYIVPNARGRGLSSLFRRHLRQALVGLGYKAIAFGVDADNLAGRASISSRPIQWTQLYGVEEIGHDETETETGCEEIG